MYLQAEWLLIGCKEAAASGFWRLRMCTALFYPCRRRVFHVVPAGWLDGKDMTGPRQLRPAYFFFLFSSVNGFPLSAARKPDHPEIGRRSNMAF